VTVSSQLCQRCFAPLSCAFILGQRQPSSRRLWDVSVA
jgi:hypothetical protein